MNSLFKSENLEPDEPEIAKEYGNTAPEDRKKWYAVYTAPRAEKRVKERMDNAGIENYLPMQVRMKQWSDRKKLVEEPLFSSYIFVNIFNFQRFEVLNVYGVIRFISFGGDVVEVPKRDIDLIRKITDLNPDDVEITPQVYKTGERIEIIAGPLMNVTGEIVQANGESRYSVRIDSIRQSVLVKIHKSFISKLEDETLLTLKL